MTGTTYDVKYAASAWPQLGNKVIAEAIQKNIDRVGAPKWTEEEQRFAKAFQASRQQAADRPYRAGEARQAAAGHLRTTMAMCPGWCRQGCSISQRRCRVLPITNGTRR
jgi:hypothetical protein